MGKTTKVIIVFDCDSSGGGVGGGDVNNVNDDNNDLGSGCEEDNDKRRA